MQGPDSPMLTKAGLRCYVALPWLGNLRRRLRGGANRGTLIFCHVMVKFDHFSLSGNSIF